jgi:hypothetical protein
VVEKKKSSAKEIHVPVPVLRTVAREVFAVGDRMFLDVWSS